MSIGRTVYLRPDANRLSAIAMHSLNPKAKENTGNAVEAMLAKELRFQFRLKVSELLSACAAILFLAYVAWSAYWLSHQGLYAIKWHTHIVFTGLVTGVVLLPILLMVRFLPARFGQRVRHVAISTVVTAVLLETALVITGLSTNYMEKRSGYYQSPYAQNMGNYYNIRHPNSRIFMKSGEFQFLRTTNSLGHSDIEWPMTKDSSVLRIITLGDSFTEGDGAPSDSTYPALLEKNLTENGMPAQVFNAGVSGADPLFCYKNLEDRLLPYRPDIVIQTISTDDLLYDIPLRGGMERFAPDTTLKLTAPPVWEPIVAASYVFRHLFRLFDLDIDKPNGAVNNPQHVKAMGALLDAVIARQDSLGSEHGFVSLWIILPMKHETKKYAHVFPFTEWMNGKVASRWTMVMPLLPCYQSIMDGENRSYEHYYWQKDGHHNSNGYRMMAQCVARFIHESVAHDPSAQTLPIP